MLLPSLSEVLNLQRQIAAAKAEALGCSLYEALLDTYEPGGNTDHIDKLFGDLKRSCPASWARCWSARRAARTSCLSKGRFRWKPSGRWASG